nr:DUF2793 domain-containing protein [uncultured Sphingomonas sp.]
MLLDALIQGCCEGAPSDTPPQSPEIGLSYICGSEPVGDWSGHAHGVACWTYGGWRFVNPFEGFQLLDRISGQHWRFLGDSWTVGTVSAAKVLIDGVPVIAKQQLPIANAIGGQTVDAEARNALAKVLDAMREHGLIGR